MGRPRAGDLTLACFKTACACAERESAVISIVNPSYTDELEFLSIKVPYGPLTSKLQRIKQGDQIYLGRKPTGTLIANELLPGKQLFMLSTGTGLAPFSSIIKDLDIYVRFEEIILVHSVRRTSDLSYLDELEAQLAGDPLVQSEPLVQLHYIPTVTREKFRTTGRIRSLIESGELFAGTLAHKHCFDPATDRVMPCGSMGMIRYFSAYFDALEFAEDSNAKPHQYVIERALVG